MLARPSQWKEYWCGCNFLLSYLYCLFTWDFITCKFSFVSRSWLTSFAWFGIRDTNWNQVWPAPRKDTILHKHMLHKQLFQSNHLLPAAHTILYIFFFFVGAFFKLVPFPKPGPLADLCQLDNGGCEQACYNLCNLKVKCGCWPGFTLAYDGKSCVGKLHARFFFF